jgi:NADPH2:quinone reductase
MRSIAISSFGPPDVLTPTRSTPPSPAAGQVAIDVAYAGLNYAEVLFRRGAVPVPLPYVPGIEVAGRVRELGEGVTDLRLGDPVAALTIVGGGGYAEVAVTDRRLVASLDGPVDGRELELAAAAPSNTTSAFLIIAEVARLRAGESVLVHAAAGGLGSQVGQVAKLSGAATVVGTVSTPEKALVARRFGFDEVLVRDDALVQVASELTAGRGFDVIVDSVGGALRRSSFGALAPGGRLLVVGNASGADDVTLGANELWFASRSVQGFNLRALSETMPELVGGSLQAAVEAVLADRIKIEVESVPIEEITEAHRRIESGGTTGKLVLDLGRA